MSELKEARVIDCEELIGKLEFYSFEEKKFVDTFSMENCLFDDYLKENKRAQFNQLVKELGAKVVTVVEGDGVMIDGYEISLYILPNAHWVNRMGYGICREINGYSINILDENDYYV